ncbi:16S rRNA (cytidine(1402)-2'-O)-methyltransferase [Kocuria sp. LUK]|uniref:16S rRNA (cytidine(1402)-2'-O)-methyltransferase n=1 Tax=Kocuria sp. LUK TaxID=2897828 RepID=UPI001E42C0D3|nr:16S rRNA (cytidine(1402)-2'-O)-methyltransferase [Kocuria sp. LUK]MCD1144885.1 16S rRNA (cytidine(1402)-2'-O)-methyltransferase [Kocuria sp. LUK]
MQSEPHDDAPAPADPPRREGPGAVVLAGTPIGNLGDASPRLREALERADVLAVEDTRRLRRLAAGLGVTTRGRVLTHHEHNEAGRVAELLEAVRAGSTVLVLSDAGMPTVSDPGYRLAEAAAAEGLTVTAVPGPSAVLTALAVSGLPTDRFTFEGFLPRKAGERSARLAELAGERRTMVFYEAPHRLAAMLTALREAFGAGRRAVVARELTKLHEEVVRGDLDRLLAWAQEGPVRGEIAVVVAGAPAPGPARAEDLVADVEALVAAGTRLKDAAGQVAERAGVGKRELYETVLGARKG